MHRGHICTQAFRGCEQVCRHLLTTMAKRDLTTPDTSAASHDESDKEDDERPELLRGSVAVAPVSA